MAAHHHRGHQLAGEDPVPDLPAVQGGTLDAPVFRVFHAVVGDGDVVAVLHAFDHVRQTVAALLEEGVGHPGVGLALVGLAAAVAGGLGAQLHGAEQVRDPVDQDAVPDDGGVLGQHAVVIEKVGPGGEGRRGAVVHGHQGTGHLLAHELPGLGAVLDEHIHLHPVAEGFVGDQAGDRGVGDHLIDPRLWGGGLQQLVGKRPHLGQGSGQVGEDLVHGVAAEAVVGHPGGVAGAHHHRAAGGVPGVELLQILFAGQEHFAHRGVLQVGADGDHVVDRVHALADQGGEPGKDLLRRVHLPHRGAAEALADRLLPRRGGPDPLHGAVPVRQGHQPVHQRRDIVHLQVVDGILTVAVLEHLDHEAALADRDGGYPGGLGVHGHAGAGDMGAQDAGVFKPLQQPVQQGLGHWLFLGQIGRIFFHRLSLQSVVSFKLRRMGDRGDLAAFLPLQADPVPDQLLGEHPAGGQVVVVLLQSVQSLFQGGGQVLEPGLFFLAQMVQVHVIRPPALGLGIDLVFDAVQTGHQDRGVAEVGVAGGVRVAKLEAPLVRAFGVGRDPDHRRAVGGGVAHSHRGLEARHQPLEGVGAGVGQGAQRADVL